MKISKRKVLDMEGLPTVAVVIGNALLEGDLEEARFRAQLLELAAEAGQFERLRKAAVSLIADLGPPGSDTDPLISCSLLRVAEELELLDGGLD